MLRLDRQKLVKELNARRKADLVLPRQMMKTVKAKVRDQYPFTSWNQFLAHQAGRGRETALAVLRSRGREVKAERSFDPKLSTLLAQHRLNILPPVSAMMKIWAAAKQGGQFPKYRVDDKGTIIYSLPRGGSIRDAGSEIHFSPGYGQARSITEKLAQERWGQMLDASGSRLKPKPVHETVIGQAKPEPGRSIVQPAPESIAPKVESPGYSWGR